jgi:hypothetical protein
MCEGRRLPGLEDADRPVSGRSVANETVVIAERVLCAAEIEPSRDCASSAVWVVLFHFRPLLYSSNPDVTAAVAPFASTAAGTEASTCSSS